MPLVCNFSSFTCHSVSYPLAMHGVVVVSNFTSIKGVFYKRAKTQSFGVRISHFYEGLCAKHHHPWPMAGWPHMTLGGNSFSPCQSSDGRSFNRTFANGREAVRARFWRLHEGPAATTPEIQMAAAAADQERQWRRLRGCDGRQLEKWRTNEGGMTRRIAGEQDGE